MRQLAVLEDPNMTIVVNNGMLDTIVDDADDGWDDNPITFAIDVDFGNIIQDILGIFDGSFTGLSPNAIGTSAQNQTVLQQLVGLWDDVMGFNINFTPGDDDADITINTIDNLSAGVAGSTFSTLHVPLIPDDADVFIPATAMDLTTTTGRFAWGSALHELGHALELAHPGDYNAGSGGTITYENSAQFPTDTVQFSIMSYFSPEKFDPTINWTRGADHPQTPMIYDILAIQQHYGVDTTTRLGDTTYGFNSTANRSVFDFTQNPDPVLTIWDAGGDHDRLDASGFAGNPTQRIDLHEGSYSDVGGKIQNIGIAFGTWIEEAIGGGGNDTLIGNKFNNYLDGGGGIDSLRGELGDDTYLVDQAADNVMELANEGTDTVNALSKSYTLSDNVERLVYVGDPDTAFTGIGNGLNNEIRGSANAGDTLDGRAGDDPMYGLGGDDLYVVDSYGDQTIEDPNAGIDTVRTALGNYTLQANIENLEFTGAGPLVTVGNDLDNTISGNIGDDVIAGAGGNDTLNGNNGNDRLSGDAGDDSLFGGAGDDLLDGGEGNDLVFGGDGNDQVSGGAGNDTVDGGSGQDQVFGGDGDDIITGGAGNDDLSGEGGADKIFGGDGNDALSGGAGADVLAGESGDDTIGGGDGNDRITGGAGNDNLSGEDGADDINGGDGNDIISGGAGNDVLTGGSGDDIISGGDGDDYINEGAGADKIEGGAGIDTVDYSSSTVGISFNANEVGTSGDALGDQLQNIEVLIGTAFADILYGDAGNNTLLGGAGNDILYGLAGQDHLDGGAGADAMAGGSGDDVYAVDNASDVVTELAGEGTDLVNTILASYTLTPNVENLTFVGTGNFTGIGNTLANVITGGAGDDILRGSAGADSLHGGNGSDTADYSTSAAGVNVNLANGVATGGDAGGDTFDRIENLTGSAFIDSLTGNNGDNILFGGIGDDTLNGGAGNDTLWGGPGRDQLVGGTGNDIYIIDDAGPKNSFDNITELANQGSDTVRSGTQTLDLTVARFANIENAELTGNGAFDLFGTSGDNVLKGNDGVNKITGGGGFDTLFGGGGADTFDYNNIADAPVSATTSELIKDFQIGIDKIDLSNIDANTTKGGNGTFAFIGDVAFTGAGQLRAFLDGADTIIQANVDANLAADFQIRLTGTLPLTSADFIL
jgi:Ca2+-binding RTX toxin-like protein